MLYAALIEEHLEEQKAILVDKERAYTYHQLHQRAMGILRYLYRQGVRKGDRVLVKSCNDGDTVVIVLACLAGGLILVLVPALCSEKEIAYIREDCSPAVIFDPRTTEDFEGEADSDDIRVRQPESAGAYILYTSGTTGEKKGVFACHKQILFCCRSILSRLKYKETDKVLCSLPIQFDYGLYQIFLSLFSKAQLFLAETDVIQMIPKFLHQWEITVYPAIPSVVNLLLKLGFLTKDGLPHLRCITFTGEYLPVELIKSLRVIFPSVEVIPMYGITECKRIAVMPEGREDKVMAGSCGLPLSGVKVHIEKTNYGDTIGELIVEGPNVMEGYWNHEGGGFGVNPETGVKIFRTGDLLSKDEEGFLYFHGRCNGLVKPGGYRISEIEIENIVREVSGVLECAAVGIMDDMYGEKVGICIYARDAEVKKGILEALGKEPKYSNMYEIFLFSMPFPRNHNGKIDKLILGKMIHEKKFRILGK